MEVLHCSNSGVELCISHLVKFVLMLCLEWEPDIWQRGA